MAFPVQLGTRGADKTSFEALVPVDIITYKELTTTGCTDLGCALQRLVPSFNYPRPVLMDGVDIMNPFNLHGMGSDQVLVLVNGKRRNQGAFVYDNSRIGKGNTCVDLNHIPIDAITRIEIMRDGAAAQYGSDAIAGIINIILKEDNYSYFKNQIGQTIEGDGMYYQSAFHMGTTPFKNISVNITGDFRNRDFINRAGVDERQQYFSGDARNDAPKKTTFRYGEAAKKDFNVITFIKIPVYKESHIYFNSTIANRDGEAPGYFRVPADNRNVRSIYPDGFLPIIKPNINNVTYLAGSKTILADWEIDASVNTAKNTIDYFVHNSLNASLGNRSPQSFYCGTISFVQTIFNFDITRKVNSIFNYPLNIAVGTEYRMEKYTINKGELNSYVDGGDTILDGPSQGKKAVGGAQVFPGFSPDNETYNLRNNFAMYADLEQEITNYLAINIIGRHENYSDFGATSTGKVALRIMPIKEVALRASAGTGFRAPSLAQSYFSSTTTNFINGVLYQNGTFAVNHPLAKLLGAEALKPERSVHYATGIAIKPVKNVLITVDGFNTAVDNRIIFSGNFTKSNVPEIKDTFDFYHIGGCKFFTNAASTTTQGIDFLIKASHKINQKITLQTSAGGTLSETKLNSINKSASFKEYDEILIDRAEKARIESYYPKSNYILNIGVENSRWSTGFKMIRYGAIKVIHKVDNPELDQTLNAGYMADIMGSFLITKSVKIEGGIHNLFNHYPEKNRTIDGDAFTGKIFPYHPFSPFGFNGLSYYFRLTLIW